MFPGLTTRLSEENVAVAASIQPKSDLVHLTDTTSTTVLATIVPPYAGFSGIMIVVNRSGAAVTTVTSGNILTAISIPVSTAVILVYSKLTDKWYPGALA